MLVIKPVLQTRCPSTSLNRTRLPTASVQRRSSTINSGCVPTFAETARLLRGLVFLSSGINAFSRVLKKKTRQRLHADGSLNYLERPNTFYLQMRERKPLKAVRTGLPTVTVLTTDRVTLTAACTGTATTSRAIATGATTRALRLHCPLAQSCANVGALTKANTAKLTSENRLITSPPKTGSCGCLQ